MDERNIKENEPPILIKLKNIASQIRESWICDKDKTEYMIELTKMLKEIFKKESIEEYFSNDEKILAYFMGDFMKEVLENILTQKKIYGENGDEIALELLFHIYKLFLKFHKNTNYSVLFEKIRFIFNKQGAKSYFTGHQYQEDKNNFDDFNFNKTFCSDYFKNNSNQFNIGDEVDFFIENNVQKEIEKFSWVRGRIKDIQNDKYIIEYFDDVYKIVSINDYRLFKANTKTLDWDWRLNLKKYDIIDCFDRSKWYPATIVDISEEKENNGYKKIKYYVAFRLYTELFKNLEDENDTYDKHINFWKDSKLEIQTDKDNQKYIGDPDNFSEHIIFHSQRIQKFNTYSKVQQKYLKNHSYYYNYNEDEKTEIGLMNSKLANITNINIEEFFNYEVNGKKNYILAKNNSGFSYYFGKLLKMMEKDNNFEEFIEILKNQPNTEEIYNIFYILFYCFPYLHPKYFEENSNIIRDSLKNYINNLKEKDMRMMPKDLIEIISKLLYKINENRENKSDKFEENKTSLNLYDEITLTLSMKTIKTSIFDKRLQGIKSLNEFIEKNQKNEEILKNIIELLKKNEIISEIFGANYHSQIISKSNEIIKLLLTHNELSEEDIKLIWSCTKRGDLEAKLTILKLLSELAPYLKENYIEMLLNNIRTNVDKKNNKEEIELVYKLSIQGENNIKNVEYCCDYLFQCLLMTNDITTINNMKENTIIQNLIQIIDKDKRYLKNIFDMCENFIKKSEKTILCYSILSQIINKAESGQIIYEFCKERNLLQLFEDNYNFYMNKAKDLLAKNKISLSEGEIIDDFTIEEFKHLINIEKRMEFYKLLVLKIYTNYDFLPFLKKVLLDEPVSPNDQKIFYDLVKEYISDNKSMNEEAIKRKEKLTQKLFELISGNDKKEITVQQLKFFIALFMNMNNEKIKIVENDNHQLLEVENIEELKGLDNLWNIIFQLKEEKVLSLAIYFIFRIYKNKDMEKLLEKCSNLLKEEDVKSEIIEKSLILLKLIIIESEKNCLFKPKSHLSLIKNCLINLPLKVKGNNPINEDEDISKYLLLGNASINDLKIIISKIYNLSPEKLSFSFTDKYLQFLKENKINEKDKIDESNNNNTLYELIVEKNNVKSDLKPKEKMIFDCKPIEKAQLMINGEMNPILKDIFKDWFNNFTEGTGKMDSKAIIKFIKGVTPNNYIRDNDNRISNLLKYDKDNKGYINENEFIYFFQKALDEKKEETVFDNLKEMGINKDLRKRDEPFDIIFINNEKLPRYKLGNELPFIENLLKQYYKNPNNNYSLIDFLYFLNTNENIYDDVLENLFNEKNENKDSFITKAINDINNYIEQNYIFIIIESILEDLEIYLYKEHIKEYDFINGNEYKLISEKYEPYDNEEKNEKKINFVKKIIKAENFQKIINIVNNLFEKLLKTNKDDKNIILKLYDCCLRGLKIINLLNNFNYKSGKENQNCLNELKEKGVYNLGFCNLSKLFNDFDFIKELDNISYIDLSNNLINYLKKSQEIEVGKEKILLLQKECLNLLINLLSSNKKLLEEYISDDLKKNLLGDLFINYFSENETMNKDYFIKNINQSITNAMNNKNKDYIQFLFKLANSLLDYLINSQSQSEENSKTEKKPIFIPDNKFFELYNNLFQIESENEDNKEESLKDNSHILKIYELIMKSISNIEQNKKVDINIFKALLQLLKTLIKDNDKYKNEILLRETEGKSLLKFLIKQIKSQIESKKDKEKSLMDDENETKDSNNNKFIFLEDIKEEKKDKDTSKDEIIEISNNFVLDCFEETKDPKLIYELLKIIQLIKDSKEKNVNESDTEEDDNNNEAAQSISGYSLKSCGHVGLKNLGCICYMNSIMQQLYMVPTFRYAIMSADDKELPKPASNYNYSIDDDNLLHQLQNMYTYLTFSEKMDYNPKDFCFSYKDFDGNPINVRAQQDSQEFYNNFCDKIENCLKHSQYKYIINDVFSGQSCSSVLCKNCQHISNRFEDFYNLTLEVKNLNNLKESLQKLSVPEIIEDFKCSNCDKKVTINKITSLNKLPNVLIVHLKRFYLDYETFHTQKINSQFEFPKKLNLKQFCVHEITKNISKEAKKEEEKDSLDIYEKEDSYYDYELKGINVHIGSADGGHYFSFIDVDRDGKNNILNEYNKEKWLQFNDSHVSVFDTNKIPTECYGGTREGTSYENCQNAYLLIYERKKKTPIRIIIDEKNLDKDKEKDNIININKDNKKQIIKEYDLSRINADKIEEVLYKKIFFDEDKNEYYKYIPFYSIPKYAPKKVYNEIMKENNRNSSKNQGSEKINYKKYKLLLIKMIKKKYLEIENENYDDKLKELIILVALKEFMKYINSNQTFDNDEKRELNSLFNYIINKLVKPLIKEETNINILKIINKILNKEDNETKIFYNKSYFGNSSDFINKENAKEISDILYDLANIFYNKKDESNYYDEFKLIYKSLKKVLDANSINNKINDKENYTIFYAYELFDKIISKYEEALQYFLEKDIIEHLLSKLDDESEKIKQIIYKILIYIIKQTKEYNKKLFILKENEKEGTLNFGDLQNFRKTILLNGYRFIKILFFENYELFSMLLTILGNKNIKFGRGFIYEIIPKLYKDSDFKEKDKIKDLINIFCTLSKINDKYTFERLYHVLGYPNLIVKQIPNKKQETSYTSYRYRHNIDSDEDKEEKKEKENEDNTSLKQKWPLFGESLINGDINKQIYEFVNLNHRENGMCLLGILFPNQYKVKEKKEEENEDIIDNIKIKNEMKKNIILDLFNNCFGEKSNYSLFKYIYLCPSTTLLYKNLYEEMKQFLQKEDKSFNFENIKEKEDKYIKNIEKEINEKISKVKQNGEDDNNNDSDSDSKKENEEFKCPDTDFQEYIGFNPDIIPGEIVREEIEIIAETHSLALYRIQYYTKYFNKEQLRDKLLKQNEEMKEKKEKNEQIKNKNIQEEQNKEEKDKKIENEGKTNEETKEEENINSNQKYVTNEENDKEKKEEHKMNDDNKEEDKKREEKRNEEIKEEEPKNEEDFENNKEEEANPINSEINNYLEHRYNTILKYDVSEKTENDFIYEKNPFPVIIEDKTLKDRNNVKSTLYRFFFTNKEYDRKYFRAKINHSGIDELPKLNCFIPDMIFDKIEPRNMVNFFNIMRIKGDLPFIKRTDASISIDLDNMNNIEF